MTISDDMWGSGLFTTRQALIDTDCACDLDPDDEVDQAKYDAAILEASQILYLLSGRTISGPKQETVRPTRNHACGCGNQGAFERMDLIHYGGEYRPYGWYCTSSRLDLHYPVISVDEVTVGGVILDPSTYRLIDNAWLLYLADEDGLPRHWPINQRIDTPDDDPGAFTVQYTWGIPVPLFAQQAALELGCGILGRDSSGRAVPDSATSVNRQGTSYSLQSKAQAVRDRATPESSPAVLRFLALVNPKQELMPSYAWSPDVPTLNPLP